MIEDGLHWLPTPPAHTGWIGLALMAAAPALWGLDYLVQRFRGRAR